MSFLSIILSTYGQTCKPASRSAVRHSTIVLLIGCDLFLLCVVQSVMFSFAETAFAQNFKRLWNQNLLKLRRVSNSFFKFSKRFLTINFSLRRSKYTQINDGHGDCFESTASC